MKNKYEYNYVPGGRPGFVYRYELTNDQLPDAQKNIKNFLDLTDNDLWGGSEAEMFQPDSLASFVRYCRQLFILSCHCLRPPVPGLSCPNSACGIPYLFQGFSCAIPDNTCAVLLSPVRSLRPPFKHGCFYYLSCASCL